MANFLHHRQQTLRFQGSTSSSQTLTCGILQGTQKGPLFLILIIDTLQDTQLGLNSFNDCTIASSINNTSPDHSTLLRSLDNLLAWTLDNYVTINLKKTTVINFSVASKPIPPPLLMLDNHTLEGVHSSSRNYSGIYLDVNSIDSASSHRLHML